MGIFVMFCLFCGSLEFGHWPQHKTVVCLFAEDVWFRCGANWQFLGISARTRGSRFLWKLREKCDHMFITRARPVLWFSTKLWFGIFWDPANKLLKWLYYIVLYVICAKDSLQFGKWSWSAIIGSKSRVVLAFGSRNSRLYPKSVSIG